MTGAAAIVQGAIAMVALAAIVSAAAPAEAGFRYVPAADGGEAGAQTDAGAATERADAGHADPAPGPGPRVSGPAVSGTSVSGPRVSGPSVSGTSVSGTSVWRIHAGETLRAALSRWGEQAGADVTFLTDRRYRIDGAAAFEGAFPDAVEALFQGLTHLPHPPTGAVSADGRSLAVTHRMRRTAERGDGQ